MPVLKSVTLKTMDIEDLIKIRNTINTKEGELLIKYLSDYVTEMSTKPIEALELKGMCKLLHLIKTINITVEQNRK